MNAAEQQAFDKMRDALKHGIKWLNICDKPRECVPLHEALSAAKAVNQPEQHLDMVQVCVERDRVWIKRGVQSFMLAYDEEDPVAVEWYADQLRKALQPQIKEPAHAV